MQIAFFSNWFEYLSQQLKEDQQVSRLPSHVV
jgi:hypothetical protein